MIPWSRDPWNEVIPGLWMGSIFYDGQGDPDEGLTAARPEDNFQTVISLHLSMSVNPAAEVAHHQLLFPDTQGFTEPQEDIVMLAVSKTLYSLDLGHEVLLRSRLGYNRTGLIAALVLIAQGYTADQAIDILRKKRSPHALNNSYFVEYIRKMEKV